MHKIVLTLLVIPSVCLAASAQNLPVLLIDTDARQAAFCCPGEAAEAEVYTLRAGIGYGIWSSAEKSSLMSADIGYKLPSGLYLGMNAVMMKDSGYDTVNARGVVTDSFAPQETAFGIIADYGFAKYLKAGIRVRYISSTLARYASASAIGADACFIFDKNRLKASLEVCNLGNGTDYGYGLYPQPGLARASASFRPLNRLLLAADADCLFSGAAMAGIGAEYCIADIVFLRAGYHYGDASKAIPSYAALGAGLSFKGLSLDAVSLLASRTLAGTMMFRLGYAF